MPRESVNPSIVRSFARRYSVEELDSAISDLAEALLTSSVANVNVLGMSVAINGSEAERMMETLEAAREAKLALEDTSGVATETALDAIAPMAPQIDFSHRRIE